jgi:TDG/mug DNA glycosylase family protein
VPVRSPTKAELAAAHGRAIPDLVAPDLRVLLVGINPSLWSGWSGSHFEDHDELLAAGIGITNLVNRATARADELTADEIRTGLPRLRRTVARWRPRCVAVLGVTAYRTAFADPKAQVGEQPERLEGVPLWVLPNPSGLNAHYQQADLTAVYARLREALE